MIKITNIEDKINEEVLTYVLAYTKEKLTKFARYEIKKELGYTDDTVFTPEVQEEMMDYSINKVLQSNNKNAETMATGLAKVWASLPGKDGKSLYADKGNKVKKGHTFKELTSLVQGYLDTGDSSTLKEYIASGEAVGGSYDSKNAGTVTNSKGNNRILGGEVLKGLSSMTFGEIQKRL